MKYSLDIFSFLEEFKGIFHARMGITKDRNSKDLTEAEEFKKWWQDTQKNYTESL